MNDDPLRTMLASLPEPPLPPDLWPAIERARQRRQTRLRVAAATLGSLALAALLAWPVNQPTFAPAPPEASRSSTTLVATPAPGPALQAIDRALQTAYARGASDDEVAPLWRMRGQLSASLNRSPDPS